MNNNFLSLNRSVSNLLTNTSEEECLVFPEEKIRGLTLRLAPDIRKFCDIQAAKLSVFSTQEYISHLLTAVKIKTTTPIKFQLRLMYERFFEIFESNNITVQEIPLILKDFNITLGKLSEESRLLDAYTPKLLDFLSNHFNVNKEWLSGQSHNK